MGVELTEAWRSTRGVVLVLAPLLLGGCKTPPEVLSRTWTSEHFVYHSNPHDRLASIRSLDALERERARILETLGLPPNKPLSARQPEVVVALPTSADAWKRPIHYYKYPSLDALRAAAPCSPAAAACFFEASGVHSRAAVNQHELVHAVAAPLGRSLRFLEEGLAEALSCRGRLGNLDEPTWQQSHNEERFDELDLEELRELYAAGAHWVSFLLREFPPDSFLRVYAELPPSVSTSQTARSFQSIYGLSLEALWEQAREASHARPWCR